MKKKINIEQNICHCQIIQKRLGGIVDFYQDFQTYVEGFGDKYKEHWLGRCMHTQYVYNVFTKQFLPTCSLLKNKRLRVFCA